MTKDELKEKAHALPQHPGVYIMMDATNAVIYVGKAKSLRNRVSQYFLELAAHSEKTRAMVGKIDHFDVILADSEFEALVLENSLIKRHKPRYNILLKDDKGYPYVRLNVAAAYPRFTLVGKKAEDGARYFGPFGTRGATFDMLAAITQALKLPDCKRRFPRDIGRERPCLNHHLGACEGWCLPEHSEAEYHTCIAQAVRLLEGDFSGVETELETAMQAAAEGLRFEEAAQLRDRLRAIQLLSKRQKVVSALRADVDVCGLYLGQSKSCLAVLHFLGGELAGRDTRLFPTPLEEDRGEVLAALLQQYYGGRGNQPKAIFLPWECEGMQALQRMLSEAAGRRVELVVPRRGRKLEFIRMAEQNAADEAERATTREERESGLMLLLGRLLGLSQPPHRIECYDVSNTGKDDIVAVETVFVDARPARSEYRCFRIRDLTAPNDYASLEQALRRRFQRWKDADPKFTALPEVLLVDGGKGQERVACAVLREFNLKIPVFGMVKDDRHRTRELVDESGREIGLQGNPALFAFVGQMQEETHRAALDYHHKRHRKKGSDSVLDEIPGIGPARKETLLRRFKSLKAIRSATQEELTEALGEAAGRRVYDYFRQ